jgi:hypothetical protein
MYRVLNCHSVEKYTEFFLWKLQFFMTFTGNAGCLKMALQWYSKCYCVASVTKMFRLKGVQTVYRSTLWTMNNDTHLPSYTASRPREL